MVVENLVLVTGEVYGKLEIDCTYDELIEGIENNQMIVFKYNDKKEIVYIHTRGEHIISFEIKIPKEDTGHKLFVINENINKLM